MSNYAFFNLYSTESSLMSFYQFFFQLSYIIFYTQAYNLQLQQNLKNEVSQKWALLILLIQKFIKALKENQNFVWNVQKLHLQNLSNLYRN